MAFGIAVLLLSAVALLLFTLRSRYGLPLFLLTAGMSVAATSVLFQTYNTSNYSPSAYFPFRAADISLYRFIGGLRAPLTQVQILRNVGCVLFFLGILTLLIVISRNLLRARTSRRFTGLMLGLGALFLLSFTAFYSPACAYKIYLRYYALSGAARESFRLAVARGNDAFHILTLLYILSPVLLLSFSYAKKNVTYFAETFVMLFSVTLLFDVAFYFMFFTGPFNVGSWHVFKSGFWFFGGVQRFPAWLTVVLPFFSFLILLFIVFNANRILSGELVLLSRKHVLKRRIDELNQNLKDVFHSEKNLMFGITILANEVKAAYGTEEGLQKLDRLIGVAQKRMEIITSSLNRIRELHIHATPTDMREVVNQALEGVSLPEGIACVRRYCDFPARCVVDQYHTCSAIKNLILNSADALQLSQRSDKTIAVSVNASREWVSLSIFDNGTGIDRRSLSRVMMPFVSTKSKTGNFGIGLPYAFRVINAQLGQMRIQSSDKENRQYTRVDILLPRERRN